MPSLLIGCGNSREKKIFLGDEKEWVQPLVTVDMDPNCGADYVMDVGCFPVCQRECLAHRILPFEDATFDEIGAYDVLEHWRQQGDWKAWFTEMAEYHRLLKPGGTMSIMVPTGDDALADPGHTRFFGQNHFRMLSQKWYDEALAKGAQVTDYRWYYKADFEVVLLKDIGGHHLAVMLRKA